MKRHLSFVILSVAAAVASANQYYVGYEGNDLPESEPGWVRYHGDENGSQGGALRYIETDPNGNSYLVIDSLRNQMIYDYAQYGRQMDPGQGELFVAEWRVKILEHYGWYNSGLGFASDTGNLQAFYYSFDHIARSQGGTYPISAGEFHSYRFESPDMAHYVLWIDDQEVWNGTWDIIGGVVFSSAGFGDPIQGGGGRSLAEWDYFRFGVVPEPSSMVLILLVCVCAAAHRR